MHVTGVSLTNVDAQSDCPVGVLNHAGVVEPSSTHGTLQFGVAGTKLSLSHISMKKFRVEDFKDIKITGFNLGRGHNLAS